VALAPRSVHTMAAAEHSPFYHQYHTVLLLLLLYDVDSMLYVNDVLACKLLYLAESTSLVSESRRCASDSASSSDCAVAC
jgi:hypothetical protein